MTKQDQFNARIAAMMAETETGMGVFCEYAECRRLLREIAMDQLSRVGSTYVRQGEDITFVADIYDDIRRDIFFDDSPTMPSSEAKP